MERYNNKLPKLVYYTQVVKHKIVELLPKKPFINVHSFVKQTLRNENNTFTNDTQNPQKIYIVECQFF